MPVRYALYRNERIAGRDRYIARVRSLGIVDREEMIDRMTRSGTTLTRSDIVGAWELLEQTALNAVLDGYAAAVPLGIVYLSVQGVFESYDDRFDAHRHRIVPQLRANSRLRRAIHWQARATRMHADELRPNLLSYLDISTGQHNRVLTPGNMGRLYGSQLKFDPDDPRQGIFILGADGSVIRVEHVAENKPRKLIFLVPLLPLGAYKLAVRADCRGARDLAVGFLDGVLRVLPPELLLEGPEEPFPSRAWQLPE
jgi:hypothetical protein